MIAGSQKRIRDLQETTPLADAARRVLAMRLEAVRDCLDRAFNDTSDRRKAIHALRVATRRAAAAIDVFGQCLPRRVAKEIRQVVRDLRRAVGAARDWDVVLHELARQVERGDVASRPAHDMLTGYAIAHRIPAQHRLLAACPDHPFGFDRLMAQTVAAVRQRGAQPVALGSHVRPLLARLVESLDTTCGSGDGDWTQLHEARLAGKRLRYTLEIVEDCLAVATDKALSVALGRLQEILGGVNDAFNAANLLRQILDGTEVCIPHVMDRYREVIERQIAAHEETMRNGREAFRGWLGEWHSAEMLDVLRTICPTLRSRSIVCSVGPDGGLDAALPIARPA
jgi:CHAD domain-containing protein